MKHVSMAIALACLLCFPAIAGEIPTGGFVPPPPPPPAAIADNNGAISTIGLAEQITDEFVLVIFGIFAG